VADLTQEDVQTILKILDEMGDRDVHLEIGELKLHVMHGGDGSRAAPLPPAAAEAPPLPAGDAAPRPGRPDQKAGGSIGTERRDEGAGPRTFERGTC